MILKDHPSTSADPALSATALLSDALAAEGWRISRVPDADFVATRGALTYVFEVKGASQSRRPLVEALLADAVLRARACARRVSGGARAMAVVAAPVLTEGMREDLRSYAKAFAPGEAHGFVDLRGRIELHGEGVDHIQIAGRFAHRSPRRTTPATPTHLFSDLNQWMLKVLLGHWFSSEHLNVPRGPIGTATALAKVAQVSVPSAARFVDAMQSNGFLERTDKGLEVVRIADLLALWRTARSRSDAELRCRFVLPTSDPLGAVGRSLLALRRSLPAEMPACLGLFSAAATLGFQLVEGVPVHVYVRHFSDSLLETFALREAAKTEGADVVLRKPRSPRSVFGAAPTRENVRCTDVLQTWLDVADYPARGAEQADLLWTRVIAPALGTS